MWAQKPTTSTSMSVGVAIQQVRVNSVLPDQNLALCVDDFGYEVRVTLHPLRARRLPLANERWVIDRKFGAWSFVAPLTNHVPTVTGSMGDPAAVLSSLLDALVELGLIKDETTGAPT